MSNGKSKGSSYEREVAKVLTIWVNGIERPYCFWRSPSSGALQTIADSMDASGDLIALRPEGKFMMDRFSVELKTGYPDSDFMKHFKDNKNNTIEDFWKQCVRDARKAKRWAMLIFKKKGYQSIIGIEPAIVSTLKEMANLPKSLRLSFECDLPDVVFFDFKQFFDIVKPKMIESISLHGA